MDFQEIPAHHDIKHLHFKDLHKDPFDQFIAWMEFAKKLGIEQLNAMSLATASKKGIPSCRMVLLKHIDQDGLIFYTNYSSRKSKELEENPHASAVIFWPKIMFQLCVDGIVVKVSREISNNYFQTRNRESQIGAWASSQGKKLLSREELEKKYQEASGSFKGKEIPLPPFWGGYRIIPNRFEFWLGGHHRLHDRFQYLKKDSQWEISRLSP